MSPVSMFVHNTYFNMVYQWVSQLELSKTPKATQPQAFDSARLIVLGKGSIKKLKTKRQQLLGTYVYGNCEMLGFYMGDMYV